MLSQRLDTRQKAGVRDSEEKAGELKKKPGCIQGEELVLSRSEEIKHKEHFITRNMSTPHGTRRSDLILEVLEALCLQWAPLNVAKKWVL